MGINLALNRKTVLHNFIVSKNNTKVLMESAVVSIFKFDINFAFSFSKLTSNAQLTSEWMLTLLSLFICT